LLRTDLISRDRAAAKRRLIGFHAGCASGRVIRGSVRSIATLQVWPQ